MNELGRRLDFDVRNGDYSGRRNAIGFDGIWADAGIRSIIVEVKTTDAYRINLDTLASYRSRLIEAGQLLPVSSILIVVGRQDTGDLEAQVRGSRHAWDVRLISADSLIKLVKIKESAEEGTVARIHELLVPFEYTRVDKIIELAFTAVTETEESIEKEEITTEQSGDAQEATERQNSVQGRTPSAVIEALRQRIISRIGARERTPLIKRGRALYWSADRELRVVCTISKHYERSEDYWYAYHPDWDAFLGEGQNGYYILGCVDRDTAYALPHGWIKDRLQELHETTRRDGNRYWHIVLVHNDNGLALRGYRSAHDYSLDDFTVHLGSD